MPWSWTLWKSKQKGPKGSASLSFSFSCANDVMPDHSCFLVAGVQVGATADCNRLRIRAVPKTRRKERRRDAGTNIHNRRGLPELPQPQVLHTRFQLRVCPPATPTHVSTPGRGHREDVDVGPGPETLQPVSFRVLRRFHAVFSRDAWTRTRLESVPAMREGEKEVVASVSVRRRVDKVPAQDHFLFGAVERGICMEYWAVGKWEDHGGDSRQGLSRALLTVFLGFFS